MADPAASASVAVLASISLALNPPAPEASLYFSSLVFCLKDSNGVNFVLPLASSGNKS